MSLKSKCSNYLSVVNGVIFTLVELDADVGAAFFGEYHGNRVLSTPPFDQNGVSAEELQLLHLFWRHVHN